MNALAAWSRNWLLPFNAGKCSTLHLGLNNPREEYVIEDTTLQQISVERDLGVLVDEHLKFREQAAAAASKANRILGLIRHSFVNLDRTTIPMLYKMLVRTHLEYGNQAWGPFNMADKKLLERVQRRATRLIPDLRHLPYEERLRELRLPSLLYGRRRGDMILMYNVMHGKIGLDREDFFARPPTARTRGHPLKVAKLQSTSRTRCNHFSMRVVNDWNALPEEVVCAPSVNCFKNRLDQHWVEHTFVAPA